MIRHILVFEREGERTIFRDQEAADKFMTLRITQRILSQMMQGIPFVADGGEYVIHKEKVDA